MQNRGQYALSLGASVSLGEHDAGLLSNFREALGGQVWLWLWPGLGGVGVGPRCRRFKAGGGAAVRGDDGGGAPGTGGWWRGGLTAASAAAAVCA